jgi:vancomycin resistance protein YoaR
MLNKDFFKKIKPKIKKLRKKKSFGITLKVVALIFVVFFLYLVLFLGRISPGVYVAGISLGGKTPEEAIETLENNVVVPTQIALSSENQDFKIDLQNVGFSYDFVRSAEAAYEIDKTGNFLYDFFRRLSLPFKKANLGLRLAFNEEKLNEAISVIAGQASIEPIYPSAKLVNGSILVEKGVKGQELNAEALRLEIGHNLAFTDNSSISLPIKDIDPTLTDEEVESFKTRSENLINRSISLLFEYNTYTYRNNDLFALLDPKGEYQEEEINKLVENLSSEINREPQDPTFAFTGGRVEEFLPAKDGVTVEEESLKNLIIENLKKLETTDEKSLSFNIPVKTAPPKTKTEDVNNLGIKELIGRGTSRFAGSISSRIHNIALAASSFNGVLVPPGAVFSFNETLGDVSLFTGYQQAYVIKDGKTVLGDGGGVCQVSTTFFRAILDAGLPVIERRAHAYRVGYYEQDSPPGFDATVYSPTTDLKFKNDTPGHLLIQTYTNTRNATLVFEIYGTSDSRVASTTKPVVTDVTPPPEDLYQDDPTLPEGTIKQIDWKAWGAKVRFNYQVVRGGETIYQKTFYSNYRPWQAIFLRGTGPAI